ncbi:hypothetical protein LJC35_05980 [Parabacteroides sp. OttesenSCG-928-N08]|nr:hypothetical protein [Parabacteroides sp. OttesenSCG-928-N08]
MRNRHSWWMVSFCLITIQLSYPVNNLRHPDTRCLGMASHGETLSALLNPALIALSERREITLQYYNRYGMEELGTLSGGFLYPNELLPAAIHLSSFGYDQYRETMMRLAVAKQIHRRWTIGVAFQYLILQTDLFDEQPSWLSTDIGLSFSPSEALLLGVSLTNCPTLAITDREIDRKGFTDYSLQLGFNWHIISSLMIIGSLIHQAEQPLMGCIGFEYRCMESFFLRCGLHSTPLSPALGVGYSFSSFTLDAVAQYHTVLGVSSGIGLTYLF